MRSVVACAIVVGFGCGSSAPSPQGPAGAAAARERVLRYAMITVGRHAGEAEVRIAADGVRRGHFTFNDRGRGPDIRTELELDASGAPRRFHVTGHDYFKAPVDERLDESGGVLRWQSTSERGEAPVGSGWYVALQNGVDGGALLAQALLRATDHRIKLLPAGEAWIDDTSTREIEIAGAKRTIRRVAIAGLGFSPALMWLDENNELFASVSSWSSVIQTGAEAAIQTLIEDDAAWGSARQAKLAARLAHRPAGGKLAITHARLFDSERKSIVPDATVVVEGDRITAVGNAATRIPAGAR